MENVTNKVLLSGHLGQEPIIKQFESKTASGKNNKMASFSLATDESYPGTHGNRIENTQWHKLVAWGEQAQKVESLLHKGMKVSLEGKLSNRSYTAKDGSTRYTTEIILTQFEVITKTEKNNSHDDANQSN
ncbi:MAG: single-stranded DNA-binding protein [Saprospiraceae bacterium]|jgi:single-strand DNA-binding protein|nr:single-stranded DNA-binding protein [Saprospiraceae bacterium]MBK6478551.1 single-stranded DNA-binding protein [Saprospiraceae bacterium]MBK6814046.1 single-stranded DNA-binding protein [Saprospiraceae bacterium]MBK7373486.1 single-stranded DNA-binding protein [Saprospiraceae bacterium]MBK7437157.1 single-stranded DNA-binding protein [Saprospiraceae bacterium]